MKKNNRIIDVTKIEFGSAATPELKNPEEPDKIPVLKIAELKSATNRLESGKTPGPDNISNEVLRLVFEIEPTAPLRIYNLCLKEVIFPIEWKKGRLVLLRKGDKPLDQVSSYYRLLVMLNKLGKVLERLLVVQMEAHLEEQGGLAPKQFGFRKRKSTIRGQTTTTTCTVQVATSRLAQEHPRLMDTRNKMRSGF